MSVFGRFFTKITALYIITYFFVKIILDNQYKRYYNNEDNKAKHMAFTCGVSSARVNTDEGCLMVYCRADTSCVPRFLL